MSGQAVPAIDVSVVVGGTRNLFPPNSAVEGVSRASFVSFAMMGSAALEPVESPLVVEPAVAINFEHTESILRTEQLLNDLCTKRFSLVLKSRVDLEVVNEKDKKGKKKKTGKPDLTLQEEKKIRDDLIGSAEVDLAGFLEGRMVISGWYAVQPFVDPDEVVVAVTKPRRRSSVVEQVAPAVIEVFLTVSVSSPLLSDEEQAHSTILTTTIGRMYNLPNSWLTEATRLEEEEEREKDDMNASRKSKKRNTKAREAKPVSTRGKNGKGKRDSSRASMGLMLEIEEVYLPKRNLYGFSVVSGNVVSNQVSTLITPDEAEVPRMPEGALEEEQDSQQSLSSTLTGRDELSATLEGGRASGGVERSGRVKGDKKDKGKAKPNKKAELERLQKLKEEEEARANLTFVRKKKARYVEWNYSFKRFMLPHAVDAFLADVRGSGVLPVEITRSLVFDSAADTDRKEAPAAPSDVGSDDPSTTTTSDDVRPGGHGVCNILIDSFAQEGRTEVSGEYMVTMQSLGDENTARKTLIGGMSEDKPGTARSRTRGESTANNGEEEEVNPEVARIQALAKKIQDTQLDAYITASIVFSRPPVPVLMESKKDPLDLIRPRRAPTPVWPSGREQVVNELKKIILEVSGEYKRIYTESGVDEETHENRFKDLQYALNQSGAYNGIREGLKPCIVRYLKEIKLDEKYDVEDAQGKHRMLSELFSRLVKHAHRAINEEFSPDQLLNKNAPIKQNSKDVSQQAGEYRLLAFEAELHGNVPKAIEIHEARIRLCNEQPPMIRDARTFKKADYPAYEPDERLAECWYEYGLFCLRNRMARKAEKCIETAIGVDERFVPALVAYASLLLEKSDHESAEVFIRAAYKADPDTPFIHALYALYYDMVEDEQQKTDAWEREIARRKLRLQQEHKENPASPESTAVDENGERVLPDVSVYVEYARELLKYQCTGLCERVLTDLDEVASPGRAAMWRLIEEAQLHRLRQDFPRVEQCVEQALELAIDDGQVICAYSILGHVYYDQNRFADAQRAYETYLEWEPSTLDPLALWRLGEIYLDQQNFQRLHEVYIELSAVSPCASSWLGVGVACIGLDLYDDAQRALQQANKLDRTNARVWGYLTLVCLLTEKVPQAKQVFGQALKLNMSDATLLRNISRLFLQRGLLDHAETAIQRSLMVEDHAASRILFGDVLCANNLHEAQCAEYARAFDLADTTALKRRAYKLYGGSLKFLRRTEELAQLEEQGCD
jgi:tetratricopeptide (TPR) repeat protein